MFNALKALYKTGWRWQVGRQKSGYDKMLLLWSFFPIPFDIYIIRYRPGSYIGPHTDENKQGKHYRMNIIIKRCAEGGEFIAKETILNLSRIKIFRPDITEHSVTEVKKGNRYILSIGWIVK